MALAIQISSQTESDVSTKEDRDFMLKKIFFLLELNQVRSEFVIRIIKRYHVILLT